MTASHDVINGFLHILQIRRPFKYTVYSNWAKTSIVWNFEKVELVLATQ